MKPKSLSAQKDTQSSFSNQRRRYERLQTDYNASDGMFKKGSLNTLKNMSEFPRKTRLQFRSSLPKEPEEIIEENLNLKSFINNLQQQLTLQRSRLQLNKKNNLQYTKQLTREFSKEVYYNGTTPNGYMVSGVKHQYQQMKSLYEAKCMEIQALCKSLENTSMQELRVYNEVLEEENMLLKKNIDSLMSIKEEYKRQQRVISNSKQFKQNGRLNSEISQNRSETQAKNAQTLAILLAEQKENIRICLDKIRNQNQKIEKMGQREHELLKKIEFLQKLLIQKGNSQTKARRLFKKIQKQKVALQAEIARLNQLLTTSQNAYENKLKHLQQQHRKKFEVERSIFESSFNQKVNQIAKLEKEIRFLSTMLSYWKPLDQINQALIQNQKEISSSQSKRQASLVQKEDRLQNSSKIKPMNDQIPQSRQPSPVNTKRPSQKNENPAKISKQEQVFIKRSNDIRSSQTVLTLLKDQSQKARVRRQCTKRHSQKAKKVRKVDLSQIKDIGQLIRFKLLGHYVNIQTVKSLLSEPNLLCRKEQKPESYITMKELKSTLMQFPFELKDSQATAVSLYIVEDSNNEYVYWDQDNEIDRSVAKSILKAVIGEYSLPQKEAISDQWSRVKAFIPNMLAALKQIAPKGLVSLLKFNQLVTGLGIQMTETLKDWIVGELVIRSNSLQELQYAAISNL